MVALFLQILAPEPDLCLWHACSTFEEETSLAWLPLTLQTLTVRSSLTTCPRLPSLQEINILCWGDIPPLGDLFPNLVEVNIDMTDEDQAVYVSQAMASIATLPRVRIVRVHAGAFPDFVAPGDFRVTSFNKQFSANPNKFEIPAGLALHVEHLSLSLSEDSLARGFDLSVYAHCKVLTSFNITAMGDGSDGRLDDWEISGFENLPASCKSVRVWLVERQFDRLPLLDLQYLIGWRIDVTPGIVDFTRKAE